MSGATPTAARDVDHVVGFYEHDDDLAEDVAQFAAEGFERDEAFILIATPEHRDACEAVLRERSAPVDQLRLEGRFVCLDAEETLAALSVDRTPDRDRFRRVVGAAVASANERGRGVRAFGEMVGLLWADGDVASVLALESYWNELCVETQLKLYCAYPAASLGDAELAHVTSVCDSHSDLVPPASYVTTEPGRPSADYTAEQSQLFLPTPRAAAAVRRFVAAALRTWGAGEDFLADAAIVATELTTNALRHASSPCRVSLQRSRASITIAVHDASEMAPVPRENDLEALSGRGLAIVAGLSSHWGTEATPDGKVVWATLRNRL